ncbi:MAG: Type 1 glutamine amidotransferase-like domain-containing protein [Oscillospiraceae bacterium]|nr:Type 1 glutamine amidotransferase-like domain-containing protein [Oscillospiraceae bacterium]
MSGYKETAKNSGFVRKILLTSAGFETKTISDTFLTLAGKKPKDIKVLFIPTAAISPAAIEVLPKCMDDLLKIGIPAANIKVFDLHCSLSTEEMSAFDAVYFTGGSPQYLLERINDTGFDKTLSEFVSNGGVYVGVSAGAIVAAGNLPNNLGYLKATLNVHMQNGMDDGVFDNDTVTHIDLTDGKAVLIHNRQFQII